MRTIKVNLKDRSYPIIIRGGLLDGLGAELKALGFKGRAAVVTNPLIAGLYADKVVKGVKEAGLDPVVITIPDGERYKSLKEASLIYDALIEHRMERTGPVIALGGGVIGDMAGFVAATYLRGVPLVHVPTTLLSQVDSSVGGKTAVNHPKGKNLIGAFYQPRAVFIDTDTLKTLDRREFTGGLAEVVKYGVIWDCEFFKFLEKEFESILAQGSSLAIAIERSCEIKAEVVAKDETERDLRAVLNFGHTFGHAIEAATGYGAYRHGEAVAIGMVMASGLSAALGACDPGVDERIKALLSRFGLPVDPPPARAFSGMNPVDSLIEAMRLDKKVISDAMRFVVVSGLGKVVIKEVNEADVRAFLSRHYPG